MEHRTFAELLDVHKTLDIDKRTKVPPGAVKYGNIWNLQWQNELAINRVYQITNLLQKAPNTIDISPGGMAWWKKPKAKSVDANFYEFRIYDADFDHSKPVRHSDFFFVGIERRLKPITISTMNEITDSTYYYGVGGILYSTCGELEASLATFAIVIAYDNGEISLLEARERYNVYIATILEEFFNNEKYADMWNRLWPFRDGIERYVMVNTTHVVPLAPMVSMDISSPVSDIRSLGEMKSLGGMVGSPMAIVNSRGEKRQLSPFTPERLGLTTFKEKRLRGNFK